MVPDRQKVRTDGSTDGMDGRTDDAKNISLGLCQGITKLLLLCIHFNSCIEFFARSCLIMPQKIHVQIMRFTCCMNMACNLTSINWALICRHDVTQERVVALTDHFANAFVCENVASVYDFVAT